MRVEKEQQPMRSDMSSLTRQMQSVIAPLSGGEERKAIRAAVTQLLTEIGRSNEARYRVLGAEISIDKPLRRGTVPQRLIQVLVVDYGNRQNLQYLIDSGGKVIERTVLGFQPAFHRDEIKEARAIAERDPRVAEFARTRGLFAGAFAPESSHEHGQATRRVGLRYLVTRRGALPRPVAVVVVDLYEQKLVSFESSVSDT